MEAFEEMSGNSDMNCTETAFDALENSMRGLLSVYSNVHRGSGHHSRISTDLYEQARLVVLLYLNLDAGTYTVLFGAPRRMEAIVSQLPSSSYVSVSSADIGLALGVVAVAVHTRVLKKKARPIEVGGGTAKLVSPDWVIWANGPDLFEAGTPAIVNVVTFARALQLTNIFGASAFVELESEDSAADHLLAENDFPHLTGQRLLDALRESLVGRHRTVPTAVGETPYINLDNSASTPTFEAIFNVFTSTLRQGRQSQNKIVTAVRSICVDALNAPQSDYDVMFTANTTQSINEVAASLKARSNEPIVPVVLITMLEHSSNDLPWRQVPGYGTRHLAVGDDGIVNLEELETTLSAYNTEQVHGEQRITLVAMSGASNVLGTCNDMAKISDIVHRHNAQLLVDGAQLVAHRPVDLSEWNVDYFAFSAHKVYAPFGVGVLVIKKGTPGFDTARIDAINASGEENAAGIAAMGKALQLLQRIGMVTIASLEHNLMRRAVLGMQRIPRLNMYGISDPDSIAFQQKKTGVIAFEIRGIMSNKTGEELALRRGIGVRYGCHCAHIIIKQQFHLGAGMQRFQKYIQQAFPNIKFPGLVRVSFGVQNTTDEVDALIAALEDIAAKKPVLDKNRITGQIGQFVTAHRQKVFATACPVSESRIKGVAGEARRDGFPRTG